MHVTCSNISLELFSVMMYLKKKKNIKKWARSDKAMLQFFYLQYVHVLAYLLNVFVRNVCGQKLCVYVNACAL